MLAGKPGDTSDGAFISPFRPTESDIPAGSLYKKMERKWATALVDQGSIRIGTLADFRLQESHRAAIGDKHEGKKTYLTGDNYQPPDGMDTPFLKIKGSVPVTFTNIVFNTRSDAYIFCFASSRFAGNLPPEYDTLIEVADPMAFCNIITESLAGPDSSTGFVALKRCVYGDRASLLTEPTQNDEWYRKPVAFAAQSEYRAAWNVAGQTPQSPLDIVIPELSRVVQIYRVDRGGG